MSIGLSLLRNHRVGAPTGAGLLLLATLLAGLNHTMVIAAPVPTTDPDTAPWARVPIAPGTPVTTRPFPPKEGRKRCISVDPSKTDKALRHDLKEWIDAAIADDGRNEQNKRLAMAALHVSRDLSKDGGGLGPLLKASLKG